MVRRKCATCLAVAAVALSACASQKPTARTPGDPLESVNRRIYAFNNSIDRSVARPVAKTYRRITPQFVKTGVSNFVSNLSYPATIVNDALQAKPMPTLRDTGRFVMNTTIGLAGFFDPASAVGLRPNNEDLGQTLGRWGLGAGPYLVVPFVGSTTLRDGFARVVDPFTSPLAYVDDGAIRYSVAALRLVNSRSRLLSVESTLENAYDPYAVVRSIYLQRRNYLVHDGNLPDDGVDELMLEEASDEPETAAQNQQVVELEDELVKPLDTSPPAASLPPLYEE